MTFNQILVQSLITLCILVKSAPVPNGGEATSYHRKETAILVERSATNLLQSCQFPGNSDFYGLGIRLGVYSQWISSLLANVFEAGSIDDNLDTNSIFLFALFVALGVATQQSIVKDSEIVILLQLCFGFIFSILTIWGHRINNHKRFPFLGSLFRLSLSTAVCAYSLWFWFLGISNLDSEQCTTFMFLFGKVNATGDSRVFLKLQSIVVFVPYGILLIFEVVIGAFLSLIMASLVFIALLISSRINQARSGWPRWEFVIYLTANYLPLGSQLAWTFFNSESSNAWRLTRRSVIRYAYSFLGFSGLVFTAGLEFIFSFIFAKPLFSVESTEAPARNRTPNQSALQSAKQNLTDREREQAEKVFRTIFRFVIKNSSLSRSSHITLVLTSIEELLSIFLALYPF